jgi:four helix bundle protein
MSKTPKDIRARAFEFAVRIIKLCQHLDKKPGVPRTLSYQLLKSGTSVGANIEEAQAGQSKKKDGLIVFTFAFLLFPFALIR